MAGSSGLLLKIFFLSLVLSCFCHAQAQAAILTGRAAEELQRMGEPHPDGQALEKIVKPKVEYKAGGLDDPFIGYSEESKADKNLQAAKPQAQEQSELKPPSLIINGIIWGGAFPQAIINNKVLKEGDFIEGAKVIEIKKAGVTVFYTNRPFLFASPAAENLENLSPKSEEGGKNEK